MNQILSKQNRLYVMGLSIIAVILHHFSYFSRLYWETSGPLVKFLHLFDNGNIGVDVFFFVSFYGLCFSINKYGLKTYYFRRLRRLMPMWIIFCVLVLCLFYQTNSLADNSILFIRHLTGVILLEQRPIDWFIPALLLVYFLFPLISLICKYIAQSKTAVMIVVPSVMVLSILLHTIICSNFALRFPIIFVGILTYLWREDVRKISLLFCYCMFWAIMLRNSMIINSMIIPIIFLCLNNYCEQLPFHKKLTTLGKYTLELYLAQMVATKFFYRDYYFMNDFVMHLIAIFIIVILTIVFHWIHKWFWQLFERHGVC